MFSYLVFKSFTVAGFDVVNRISEKSKGIAYADAKGFETASDLNANADKQVFDRYNVVFSDQDIPETELLAWKWNGSIFVRSSGAVLTQMVEFRTKARSMWAARKAKINALKADILVSDWNVLTPQHRKVLLGAKYTDFTEADWDAVGLDDVNYVGDLNYSLNKWQLIMRALG